MADNPQQNPRPGSAFDVDNAMLARDLTRDITENILRADAAAKQVPFSQWYKQLSQIKADQGDFNGLLKDSLKELTKADVAYKRIQSKLEALEQGEINVGKIKKANQEYATQEARSKIVLRDLENQIIASGSDTIEIYNEKIQLEEKLSELVKASQDEYKKFNDVEKNTSEDVIRTHQEKMQSQLQIQKLAADELEIENKILATRRAINNVDTSAQYAAEVIQSKQAILSSLEQERINLGIVKRDHEDILKAIQDQGDPLLANYESAVENLNSKKQEILAQKELISIIEDKGNVELIAYETIAKTTKQYEKLKNEAKEKFDLEVKVSRQLGISGNVVKLLAGGLGVGTEAYEEMVVQARNLVDENGKVTNAGKWKVAFAGIKTGAKSMYSNIKDGTSSIFDPAVIVGGVGAAVVAIGKKVKEVFGAIKDVAKSVFKSIGSSVESAGVVSGLTSGVSKLISTIPIVGGLLGGLLDTVAGFLDFMVGIEDYIIKAGRSIGLGANEAKKFNDQLKHAGYNSNDVYINSRKLLNTQVELSKQSGLNNRYSIEALETATKLKDLGGIDLDTNVKLADVARITGQSMQGVTKSVLGQVVALKKATGISFNYQAILKEAANQSGYLSLQFSKFPKQLANSLVAVKAMGLELKKVDGMASSFLDFESSISREFETQLLTGKDINLQKAREAFLNNDLATAAAEITKQTGDAGEFMKLNRFEQESLAETMGMSRDDMAEMLKQQELYSKFGATNQKTLLASVDTMRKMNKEQKAIALAGGEEAYNSLVNLSTQEKMMSIIEKIKQSIVDFVESSGIMDKFKSFVEYISKPDNIRAIVDGVRNTMTSFVSFMAELGADILELIGNIPFVDSTKWDINATRLRLAGQDIVGNINSVGTSLNEKSKTAEQDQAMKKETVKDAVLFPNNNLLIKKDPLDYTVFMKNPENLVPPPMATNSGVASIDYAMIARAVASTAQSSQQSNQNQMSAAEITAAVTKAIKDQTINVNLNANLAMAGEPTAKVMVKSMRNTPITGFDNQAGPMSANV